MHDLRYAVRRLSSRPAFSTSIAATLALGIGLNALIFSVVHAVLIQPLPFARPHELVNVWQTQPGNVTRRVAPANFLDWRTAKSFSALAAYDARRRSLAGDEPERLAVATVSANFFSVLEVQQLAGTLFTSDSGDGLRAAVLREDLWRRRFGGDPSIVGRTITLDDERLVVTGIVPTSAAFPEETTIWIRARSDVPEIGATLAQDVRTIRDARYLRVIGRLAPGVTRQHAQAEMDALSARLRDAYPDANAATGANVVDLHAQVTGGSSRTLTTLFAIGGCVLAIAAANVAMLFIAGAIGRTRELQVRAALGASRFRLARELTLESVLLAVLGTGAGLFFAWTFRPALIAMLPAGTPRLAGAGIGAAVVAFAVLSGLVTSAAAGVLPGWLAIRESSLAGLRAVGRGGPSRRSARLTATLMAAQLALVLVLLTGAGLMLRTLWTLQQRDPGIDVERLLTLDVTIPDARSRGRAAAALDIQRMVESVAGLPGVTAAGAIQTLPLSGRGSSGNIRVEGRVFSASDAPDVAWRTVTPEYFRAAGVTIGRGRAFTAADREGTQPVAIVNETLAALLWPNADPLGRRIGTGLDGDGAPVTIVGVAADVPQEGVATPVLPEMYRPLAQPSRFTAEAMSLVIRTDGNPATIAAPAREAVRRVHPQAPVAAVRPMSAVAAAGLARETTAARALGIFGALAMLLAGVGLHGMMARLVNDRAIELGIKLALGADPGRLRWEVLRRTLRLGAAGAFAGLLASALLTRQLTSMLHGVSALDPLALGGAASLLVVVMLTAAIGPARRAGRIDPLAAMRAE